MADFGIVAIPTHYTIPAVEMARWAEGNGFESLWFGEHSHIPTSRKSPFPMGGELPEYYKEFFDPFIGLTAAAAQAAVGIYSLGYQIGQLVSLIGVAVNLAWMPFFYEHGERPEGPAILREMSSLSVGALAIVAVLAGVLAPEAIAILAPKSWGPDAGLAASVVPLVAFAALIQGLYFMVASPIFLHRRTRTLPLLTIAAGAVNVGLNVVLIPRIGILGAAWSTIAGYLTMLVLSFWYAGRSYPVTLDWGRMAALFAVAAAALLSAHTLELQGLIAAGLVHLAIGVGFSLFVLALLRGPWKAARQLVRAGEPVAISVPPG